MEPQKRGITGYVIPIIVILIALFMAMHLAVSYEVAAEQRIVNEYEDGEGNVVTNEKFNISVFFNDFADRITNHLTEIKFVRSTPKFLVIAGLIGLIGIAYIFTSRRNFIDNKEYGTAEWGTSRQIAHLAAANIKIQEIKAIRKKRGIKKSEKRERIAQAKQKYADSSNIIFTQSEQICMYNYELNNNTMIIGGSGSGKTRGYVLPNILQCCASDYSPSIVVTDPKGEIISKIGHFLEMQGYVIKVLNLKEQNRSFCFNPFCYILKERYEEQISTLVSSIMDSRNDNKDQKSNDPFWDDMAKVLLKSIFYAVYEGYPAEERNMSTVMEMFRWFEVSDNDDRYKNPTRLDRFFEVFGDKNGILNIVESILAFFYTPITIQNNPQTVGELCGINTDKKYMMENLAIPIGSSNSMAIERYRNTIMDLIAEIEKNGELNSEIRGKAKTAIKSIDDYIELRRTNYASPVIRDKNGNVLKSKPIGVKLFESFGDVNSNPALRNWEDFRTKCKGKTAQSVTATALAKLAPFDEEQIRRIFSKDDMELDLVGERRTALFIVLPPTNKTYNFIANVLYTLLFEQLEYCATVKHNQSLPVPVRFICDEFYNTGRIPNFENILSYARSFGIGISIILQSLDQIKEMYEKSWGTVLDNCSTFLYLGGIRHADTLEYISKLLGKGTFDKKTYSQTKGKQSSSSTSYDKIGRELLDPSEIQRMNKKRCLLFVSGYQPYMSQKFNYTKHKNYKYTSDSNNKNLYYYKTPDEVEARQIKQKKENISSEERLDNSFRDFPPVVENSNEILREEDMKKDSLQDTAQQSTMTPHIESSANIMKVTQATISMLQKSGGNILYSSDQDISEDESEAEVMRQLEITEYTEVDTHDDDISDDKETIVEGLSEIISGLQNILTDFNVNG